MKIQSSSSADTDSGVTKSDPITTDSDSVRKFYAVIAKQRYFKGLTAEQIKALANSAVEAEAAAGESIFEEGDQANRFYIILEGKVLIEAETPDRGRVPIQTLGPGDDLGWSWFFPPYHTQFGARALTKTTMLLFYAPHLRQECERDVEFGYELMKRVASVMLDRLQAVRRKLSEAVAHTHGSDH